MWPIVLSLEDKEPPSLSPESRLSFVNKSESGLSYSDAAEKSGGPRPWVSFLGYGGEKRFLAERILFEFFPPPLFFVAFLFSVRPRCGTEDAFVGLNQGDCFHHQTIHACPSPVVKHQPGRGTAAPLCGAPYHPDFTSACAEPLFCSQSKESICSGEGRGVPIASTNTEVKGKIDGRKFT